MSNEWWQDEFTINTDPARIDLGVVHGFLTGCYWSKGVPLETVRRAAANSLNFCLYRGREQVGFRRLAAPDRWMERWDRDVYSR